MKTRARLFDALAYALLIFGALVMVGPFVWMVSTSLKEPADQFSRTLIPNPVTLQNYTGLWDALPFTRLIWNSFKIASLATIGQLLTCSMAGFAFAVVRFRGRNALFVLLLVIIAFKDADWVDGVALGLVALVVTLAWQVFAMLALRRARTPVYDEPSDTPRAAR